jgi:hypothetical protein
MLVKTFLEAKTRRGAIMRIRNFADRYNRGGRASVGACPSRRKNKK